MKSKLISPETLPWYVRLAVRAPLVGKPVKLASSESEEFYVGYCEDHGFFLCERCTFSDSLGNCWSSIFCPKCDKAVSFEYT